MERIGQKRMVGILEEALKEEYERALTHAVRYRTRWDEARVAYRRLEAFKRGLERAEPAEARAGYSRAA